MATNKQYDQEFKVQAVKLAQEIGQAKAIWRYFMSYWNNRRIYSRNGGLPPMVKR